MPVLESLLNAIKQGQADDLLFQIREGAPWQDSKLYHSMPSTLSLIAILTRRPYTPPSEGCDTFLGFQYICVLHWYSGTNPAPFTSAQVRIEPVLTATAASNTTA